MTNIQRIREFCNNTHGNIAIIFALSSVIILIAVAVATSTVRLHNQKTKLDAAADAAVLSALIAASEALAKNEANEDYVAIGKSVGESSFALHIADIQDIAEVTPEITFDLSANRTLSGKLTYRTTGETILSSFLGRDEVGLSNTVRAVREVSKFSRVNFLVDNSMSMGVADTFNQQRLEGEFGGCAVACHMRLRSHHEDTYLIAKQLNIRMRIDTVKDAITQILEDLEAKSENDEQFEIAIYTFSNSVEEVLAPTTNLALAKFSVQDIDLARTIGQGGTNMQHSLRELAEILPQSGLGVSEKSRQSYVVALTDGIENSIEHVIRNANQGTFAQIIDPEFEIYQPSVLFPDVDRIQGVNPESCQDLKLDGHIVGFINPTYLIPNLNNVNNRSRERFEYIRDTLIPKVPGNSEACASRTELSFSAQTEADVARASEELFEQLFSQDIRLAD